MAMILVKKQIKYYEAAIVICLFDEFSGHTFVCLFYLAMIIIYSEV